MHADAIKGAGVVSGGEPGVDALAVKGVSTGEFLDPVAPGVLSHAHATVLCSRLQEGVSSVQWLYWQPLEDKLGHAAAC